MTGRHQALGDGFLVGKAGFAQLSHRRQKLVVCRLR